VKWLPAIIAALVLSAGVVRADTLTPRAFTERVARAVLAAMPSAKVAVNADLQFAVRYANGASASSDLAKAYKSYEREPQHLDDIVVSPFGPDSDGVLLISAGGEFDASLLLADNLWSGGQVKVDGDIVVAVPAKDVLIATGSHNAPGLVRLRAAAAKFASGPNGLTTALFVYRDGKFVRFE